MNFNKLLFNMKNRLNSLNKTLSLIKIKYEFYLIKITIKMNIIKNKNNKFI